MTDGNWTAEDVPDCSGDVAVVTGANSGLGLEVTRELARSGAHVVMACRSLDRGERAREEIQADVDDAALTVEGVDLGDLSSIRAFAERFDHESVDLLVNNAGVMAIPRRETVDGFERQFGVNHLGHFALTGLLLDRLLAADHPRVVAVSSGAHRRGEVDFDDLQRANGYGKWDAYARSKLANLLFAFELDRRLDAAGESALATAAHPGYAATNLQLRGPEMAGSAVRRLLMWAANLTFAQSAAKGALPILYAATAPDVEGGEFYGPGGFLEMRGYPSAVEPAERAQDRETARRLWAVSEELTGLAFDLPAG
jgi:NAD(P)-dependent dehydrogenase (short-subunit alcohol dehydrogenase family)